MSVRIFELRTKIFQLGEIINAWEARNYCPSTRHDERVARYNALKAELAALLAKTSYNYY